MQKLLLCIVIVMFLLFFSFSKKGAAKNIEPINIEKSYFDSTNHKSYTKENEFRFVCMR